MMESFRVEAWRKDGFLAVRWGLARLRGMNLGRTVAVLLALATASVQLPAQTSLGTVLGNVTDESGAAIPHVAVTITNEETSAVRSVTTSDAGSYVVPALPAGS
jgi:hypothetical protein